MTVAQFEALVRKLERSAKDQPKTYQMQVGLLAALGYVYIFGIVILLLALIGGILGGMLILTIWVSRNPSTGMGALNLVKILIPMSVGVMALIGVVFRAFQVHFPVPQGIPVDRAQAPRLFAALDEICNKLSAPRFHHVLMDDEFNAYVSQHPRFGLLGGHVNYLVLGLPFMEGLSPAQFRSVLSHEIGHLSRSHGRFGGWIYHVRQTWDQMLTALNRENHVGILLFLPFFRWYSPYFAAYSFVLRRGNEYAADRCAAEVCGAEVTAQALIMGEIKGRAYGQEFWGGLLKQARTEPRVPQSVYGYLQTSLREPSEKEGRWYEDALEERTGLSDTHPGLTDRLAALGYRLVPGGPLDLPKPPLPLPPPVTEIASTFYLGPLISRIVAPMDAKWRQNIADAWVQTHQEAQRQQQTLEDLEAKVAEGKISLAEAWQRAALTADLHGDQEGLPLVQEFLRAKPDHAQANFVLGKMLLERKDARGLPYIKKAMETTPEAVGAGCETISWFLRGQGRTAEAASYRERGRRHERDWEGSQAERAGVAVTDKFLYHGLPAEETAKFREQMSSFPQVWRVYLVRKQVKFFPERPLYVLGIVPNASAGPDFANRLGPKIKFPGETIFIILEGDGKKFERPLAQLSTALIYSRQDNY